MSLGKDLYPRLLGPAWERLAPPIRQVHIPTPDGTSRRGTFAVRRGRTLLARLLLWLLRMPPESAAVPVSLLVRRDKNGVEQWLRSFASVPFESAQYERPAGVLCERVGAVECYFALETEGEGLRFRQLGAALCVGPLRAPLPALLRPSIVAASQPLDATRVRTEVRIAAPFAGLLLEYKGEVESGEHSTQATTEASRPGTP